MIDKEQISATQIRHYSTEGFWIKQVETGVLLEEAVDLIPCRYHYVETDILIYVPEETIEESEDTEHSKEEINNRIEED